MNIPASINVQIYRKDEEKLCAPDFYERAADVCLTPWRSWFGHQVTFKNGMFTKIEKKTSHIALRILSALLFPITAVGLLLGWVFQQFSPSHSLAYHLLEKGNPQTTSNR